MSGTNNETSAANSVVAATAAAMLGSVGPRLNGWSMLFALAAMFMVILKPAAVSGAALLVASLLAALTQLYFALRCAFDAAVFDRLGGDEEQYRSFDQLLVRWRLQPARDTTRTLEQRAQGALRLLRRQVYSFVLQLVLLALGVIVAVGQGYMS